MYSEIIGAIASLVILTNVDSSPTNGIRLCGSDLADALTMLCNSTAYRSHTERDVPKTGNYGVARECCLGTCTFEDMLEYCEPLDDPEKYINEAKKVFLKDDKDNNIVENGNTDTNEILVKTSVKPPYKSTSSKKPETDPNKVMTVKPFPSVYIERIVQQKMRKQS